MSVNVYMNFNGNCREAVNFYAKVFGGNPRIMTFGEAPPNPGTQLPELAKDLVLHANLFIEGTQMMFSDVFPGMPFNLGNNLSISVTSKDMEAIKGYFHKLKESGTVQMDLQETFWSKCYGSLTDQFGIIWQLSYESEDMN